VEACLYERCPHEDGFCSASLYGERRLTAAGPQAIWNGYKLDPVIGPVIDFFAKLPWTGGSMTSIVNSLNCNTPTSIDGLNGHIKAVILEFPHGQKLTFKEKEFYLKSYDERRDVDNFTKWIPGYGYKCTIEMRLGPFDLLFNVTRRVHPDDGHVVFWGSSCRGDTECKMVWELDTDAAEIQRLEREVADLRQKVAKNEQDIQKLKQKRALA
jgi:hypothetical protein